MLHSGSAFGTSLSVYQCDKANLSRIRRLCGFFAVLVYKLRSDRNKEKNLSDDSNNSKIAYRSRNYEHNIDVTTVYLQKPLCIQQVRVSYIMLNM